MNVTPIAVGLYVIYKYNIHESQSTKIAGLPKSILVSEQSKSQAISPFLLSHGD